MHGVRRPVASFAMAAAFIAVAAGASAAGASAKAAARSTASAQQSLRNELNAGVSTAGSTSGVYVVDLNTGKPLFSYQPNAGRLPASVEKLYTTSTALLRFGANATLTTRVLGTGFLSAKGTWQGTLFLKGGGDPSFGSRSFDQANYGTGATVERLVRNLINQSGIKAIQGRIVADGSYFDALRGTPATGFSPSIFVEGMLDGISFDRGWADSSGLVFQTRPTLFAAQQFEAALSGAGVKVPATTKLAAGPTPAGAQQLGLVHSPRIGKLLQLTNTPSDNYFAETLLKDIGASFGGAGSTAAGAAVVRSEVASVFGIHPRLNDGSGLSYYDSTSPHQIVTLLEHMQSNSVFLKSLAIAGETGTLAPVAPGTIAQGRCRGKTGTLNAVANVVGYCQAKDGHTLAFAFLVNGNTSTDYVHNVVEADMMTAVARYNG